MEAWKKAGEEEGGQRRRCVCVCVGGGRKQREGWRSERKRTSGSASKSDGGTTPRGSGGFCANKQSLSCLGVKKSAEDEEGEEEATAL